MNNGIVEFQSPITSQQSAITGLNEKILRVEKRSPSELAAIEREDIYIRNALFNWRESSVNYDMQALLKTPDDVALSPAELDLAGWVRTYAEQLNIPFKTALDRIFEYLKRNPKSLEWYTKGDVNFAESDVGLSGFNLPHGWNSDPSMIKTLRMARVYQAFNPECDLVGAVIEVSK